jgi:hypothetical protein
MNPNDIDPREALEPNYTAGYVRGIEAKPPEFDRMLDKNGKQDTRYLRGYAQGMKDSPKAPDIRF